MVRTAPRAAAAAPVPDRARRSVSTASRTGPSGRARNGVRAALFPPLLQLFALHPARCPEAEAVDDERIVVLSLPLLIGPVAGADAGLENELIALARIAGDGFAQRTEGDEPQAGGDFTRGALLILAGVVIADQAEARVGGVALCDQFRIFGKIANGSDGETVHARSPRCRRGRVWTRCEECRERGGARQPSQSLLFVQKFSLRRAIHWCIVRRASDGVRAHVHNSRPGRQRRHRTMCR